MKPDQLAKVVFFSRTKGTTYIRKSRPHSSAVYVSNRGRRGVAYVFFALLSFRSADVPGILG